MHTGEWWHSNCRRGGGLLFALLLVGCSADRPVNASFPLKLADARDALREMNLSPMPLERPVIVLSGLLDPGYVAEGVAQRIRRAISDPDMVRRISYFGIDTFDECRDRVIESVDRLFPSTDETFTVEVDVVGISMGGLVARYASGPRDDGGRRLKIARLFTIATPHQGVAMTMRHTWDSRIRRMRRGSRFLLALNESEQDAEYELFPYTRLGDAIVGPENTAPPGQVAWWVPNIPGTFAHIHSMYDPRILADIMRRIRRETPFSTYPRLPLP